MNQQWDIDETSYETISANSVEIKFQKPNKIRIIWLLFDKFVSLFKNIGTFASGYKYKIDKEN